MHLTKKRKFSLCLSTLFWRMMISKKKTRKHLATSRLDAFIAKYCFLHHQLWRGETFLCGILAGILVMKYVGWLLYFGCNTNPDPDTLHWQYFCNSALHFLKKSIPLHYIFTTVKKSKLSHIKVARFARSIVKCFQTPYVLVKVESSNCAFCAFTSLNKRGEYV